MNRRIIKIVMGAAVIAVLAGCAQDAEQVTKKEELEKLPRAERPSTSFVGEVLSVTNAGRYVYLELQTKDAKVGKVWVAARQMDAAPGDTVSVLSAMLMVDFYSPTLKRTFEAIYFTGNVIKGDISDPDRPYHTGGQDSSGSMGHFYSIGTNGTHGSPHGMPNDGYHGNPHGSPHGMPKDAYHGNPHGTPKGSYHGNPHGSSQEMPKDSYHGVKEDASEDK